MAMFANIMQDGKPLCPMKGCENRVIEPDTGGSAIGEFSPDATARAYSDGLLAEPSGFIIFHKACAGQ